MRINNNRGVAPLLAATLLALVGCSSNDDNDAEAPTPPAPPPPTAGDTIALTSANRLVTFDRAAPSVRTSVTITGLQSGENVVGIDIRPGGTPAGTLVALGNTGRLYTIDAATGAATFKASLAPDPADTTNAFTSLDAADIGFDFNPVPDRVRVVSSTGQNLRANVDTGATFTDTVLTSGGSTRTGVSAVAYTNSFSAACRTALFYIDTTTDSLLATLDPNGGVVTEVGNLGVNADGVNGLEIVTAADGSNAALAVLSVAGAPSLYTINLTTGAATAAGAVSGLNSGETIRGLTAAPPASAPTQTAGELFAISETNKLVSINSAAPQKLCTTASVTGLQSGENVVGIDLRPADGALYAVGSTGRIYTLDPATAAATLKSTLAADPADATDAFAALDGVDFGVDFNPVPDRLRIVSNTGQDLRINVDTGATTTDGVLNPPGSSVSAAAYTNSFAGAGTTTLYVLDAANDRLQIQGQTSGNPNNGDLGTVGPLGMIGDVQSIGGFDINARNRTALAALTLAGATASELHSIDLATGAATRINAIGGGERVRGLTLAAAPQATAFAVTSDNRLVSFRPATPGMLDSSQPITGLQGGEAVVAVDFRPATGRLHALSDAGRVYVLDPTLAAVSAPVAFVANAADATLRYTALTGTTFAADFNPVVDLLRTLSDAESNLRSNVDTGATTTDTQLNRAPFAATAAAYTNSFAGAMATTLYVIDTRNDRLQTQNPPNDGTLNDVGALGIDADAVSGFDIVGPDTALAVLSTTATPAALYSVNLTAGTVAPVGSIGLPLASDRITGFAAAPSASAPAPNSTVVALINGSAIVAFARNAPPTLAVPLPITGLQSGETVLGIDFRPANGALYAVGSSGRLYTVNTATGAATLASTLVVDPTDATDPFTMLAGAAFGVDFNPVPDRLRIVTDTGQNLRINVDTGATLTDGALNAVAPDAVAAAYTRSFAGTTTTQLFAIDAATNTLQLQNPPNDGVLVTIGRLDPALTFTSLAGFDIAGGDDGLVLAALQVTGEARSTLYRVNLRTGAATPLGAIGPAATPLVRGLTLRLQ